MRNSKTSPNSTTPRGNSLATHDLSDIEQCIRNVHRIALILRCSQADTPPWVVNAARRIFAMYLPRVSFAAVMSFGKIDNNPRTLGALHGHYYAMAAAVRDWWYGIAAQEDERLALAGNKIEQLTQEIRDILKSTADLVVTAVTHDVTEFWCAFADALKKGAFNPTTGQPTGENDRLPILLALVENWQEIETGRTSKPFWSLGDLESFLNRKLDYSKFRESEFQGEFTTSVLKAAIAADGIPVPEAPSEIESLNRLLSDRSLRSRFSRISLPMEAETLTKRESSLRANERIQLNRFILEAAYPRKCPKKVKSSHNIVGSKVRLEKICQDIDLRFRRGRRSSRKIC